MFRYILAEMWQFSRFAINSFNVSFFVQNFLLRKIDTFWGPPDAVTSCCDRYAQSAQSSFQQIQFLCSQCESYFGTKQDYISIKNTCKLVNTIMIESFDMNQIYLPVLYLLYSSTTVIIRSPYFKPCTHPPAPTTKFTGYKHVHWNPLNEKSRCLKLKNWFRGGFITHISVFFVIFRK